MGNYKHFPISISVRSKNTLAEKYFYYGDYFEFNNLKNHHNPTNYFLENFLSINSAITEKIRIPSKTLIPNIVVDMPDGGGTSPFARW